MNKNRIIITGLIIIWSAYFLIKTLLYHGLTIKKGVVVGTGYRHVGYSYRVNSSSTNSYPTVVFEGPLKPRTEELRTRAYSDNSDTSPVLDIHGNPIDTGFLYTTQPPLAPYVFKEYKPVIAWIFSIVTWILQIQW